MHVGHRTLLLLPLRHRLHIVDDVEEEDVIEDESVDGNRCCTILTDFLGAIDLICRIGKKYVARHTSTDDLLFGLLSIEQQRVEE